MLSTSTHLVRVSSPVLNLPVDPLKRLELILEADIEVEIDRRLHGDMGSYWRFA